MISKETAIKFVEQQNTPYLQIFDYSKNLLWTIADGENAATAAEKLSAVLEDLVYYGKVRIKAATKENYKGNWQKFELWEVNLNNNIPAQTGANNAMVMQQQNPMAQFQGMMQMFGMFQTMMQPQQTLQMEIYRKEMEWEKRFNELKNQKEPKEDFFKQAAPFMPFIGKLFKIQPDEMDKMIAMSAKANGIANQNTNTSSWKPLTPNRTAGPPRANNLVTDELPVPTPEQLQKLTPEEKLTEINAMLDKLAVDKKVCGEDMIIILYIMYNRPQLAPQAYTMYQQGII